MNVFFRLLPAALFLILCSCAAVPNRSPAPLDLPQNFSESGESPAPEKWWKVFAEPDLDRLVEKALSENFSLRGARERIIQAQALATQAGASLLPAASLEGAATTTRNYQTNSNSNSLSLGIGTSYEVDLWGRLKNTRNGALLDLAATTADVQTAQITLSADVALTWFQLVESRLQQELLQQQKETNQKVLELITAQFRAGKTDISDVLQQRQLVESNNGALANLRADTQVLENQLKVLTGEVVNKEAAGKSAFTYPLADLPPLPETGVPLDLIKRRPDVQSSFFSLQAADQRAAAAVAARFPRLSLSGSLSTSGSSAKDLFSDWFSNLAANLLTPVIDGGYLRAEAKRTGSVARQQLDSYSQTVLEAMTEVENCLILEKQRLNYLQSEETQLQLASETIVHVTNRYRQGVVDYQRVLSARLSEQTLQRSILTTRLALLSNRITLYRALSGAIE